MNSVCAGLATRQMWVRLLSSFLGSAAVVSLAMTAWHVGSAWTQGTWPAEQVVQQPSAKDLLWAAQAGASEWRLLEGANEARRSLALPYPQSVMAAGVPLALSASDCDELGQDTAFTRVRAEPSGGVPLEVPSAFAAQSKVLAHRVLAPYFHRPYVLALRSSEPALWEVNRAAGAQLKYILLQGHPDQAVLGVPNAQDIRYLPPRMAQGLGLCGKGGIGDALELERAYGFYPTATAAPEAQYPYRGPAQGLFSENNLGAFVEALSYGPTHHEKAFRKKYDAQREAHGWRYANPAEIERWNRQVNGRSSWRVNSLHKGLTVLVRVREDAQFLDLPEEVARRVAYLGPWGLSTAVPGFSLLLDETTHSCRSKTRCWR